MKEAMREQWVRESQYDFCFCEQVAFSVGRHFSALPSMDWKATIGGFQVLASTWVPRTKNGLETVAIICFENAISC